MPGTRMWRGEFLLTVAGIQSRAAMFLLIIMNFSGLWGFGVLGLEAARPQLDGHEATARRFPREGTRKYLQKLVEIGFKFLMSSRWRLRV